MNATMQDSMCMGSKEEKKDLQVSKSKKKKKKYTGSFRVFFELD